MAEQQHENKTPKLKPPAMTPAQLWRLFVLGTSALAFGALFWWAFQGHVGVDYTAVSPPAIIGAIVVQLLLFCAWLAMVGIIGMAASHYHPAYVAVVPSTLIHAAFYGISTYTALVFILINLAFFYFTRGVQREAEERVHFSVPQSIRSHLGLALLIVLLCVSLLFYLQTVVTTDAAVDQVDILANSAAGIMSNIIAFQVEGYQPEMSLDEFILIGLQRLGEQFVPKDVATETPLAAGEGKSLSEALLEAIARGELTREQVGEALIAKAERGELTAADVVSPAYPNFIQEEITRIRLDLLQQFEVEASGQEPIISVLRRIVKKIIADNIGPYEPFIPPFLALALFLVLIVFTWLYQWLIKGFAILFVWLLRHAGVLVFEYRDIRQQIINLAKGR